MKWLILLIVAVPLNSVGSHITQRGILRIEKPILRNEQGVVKVTAVD